MDNCIDLDNWDGFEVALRDLRKAEQPAEAIPLRATFLFRGQTDAQWDLLTTLERRQPHRTTWNNYARLVGATSHHVQTFTDRQWMIPPWTDTQHWGAEYDDHIKPMPAYDYCV